MPMHEEDRLEVFGFVRDLIQATNRGVLTWTGNQDGTAFSLETPNGTVYIASLGGSNGHPYVVTVVDPSGREVFEYRTELGDWYNEDEDLIARLFTAAHRSLFDVSGTIKRMRRSLDLD